MNISDLCDFYQERIDVDTKGCWLWTGSIGGYGYGRVMRLESGRVRSTAAHRALWQLLNGDLPAHVDLHHECSTRRCVNPAHLRPMGHVEHAEHHKSTHCKRGHALADAYHYARPKGRTWRMCRQCQIERQRRYQAVRKSA